MDQDTTPLLPVSIFLREADLTLMVQTGDREIEALLAPKQAIGLGVAMICAALGREISPQEVMDAGCELISRAMRQQKADNMAAILARHEDPNP